MATNSGVCHNDPNFAVICSFLDRYCETLGLPNISYAELESWIEETKRVNPNLRDLHIRMLRRTGKKCSNVTADRWERALVKFCHKYSTVDAWELERLSYRYCKISTKLRLLKNLLECQFDTNMKFKDKVNEMLPEDMRVLPVGRDKHGLAYWYMLDKSLNLRIYRESLDDVDSETWELVCRDRDDLAKLIENLEKGDHPKLEKSDLSDASFKSEPVSDFNEDSKDSFTRSRSCTPIKPSPLTIKLEPNEEDDTEAVDEQKTEKLTMKLKIPSKIESDSPSKRLKDKFEKEKGHEIKKKCKLKLEDEGDHVEDNEIGEKDGKEQDILIEKVEDENETEKVIEQSKDDIVSSKTDENTNQSEENDEQPGLDYKTDNNTEKKVEEVEREEDEVDGLIDGEKEAEILNVKDVVNESKEMNSDIARKLVKTDKTEEVKETDGNSKDIDTVSNGDKHDEPISVKKDELTPENTGSSQNESEIKSVTENDKTQSSDLPKLDNTSAINIDKVINQTETKLTDDVGDNNISKDNKESKSEETDDTMSETQDKTLINKSDDDKESKLNDIQVDSNDKKSEMRASASKEEIDAKLSVSVIGETENADKSKTSNADEVNDEKDANLECIVEKSSEAKSDAETPETERKASDDKDEKESETSNESQKNESLSQVTEAGTDEKIEEQKSDLASGDKTSTGDSHSADVKPIEIEKPELDGEVSKAGDSDKIQSPEQSKEELADTVKEAKEESTKDETDQNKDKKEIVISKEEEHPTKDNASKKANDEFSKQRGNFMGAFEKFLNPNADTTGAIKDQSKDNVPSTKVDSKGDDDAGASCKQDETIETSVSKRQTKVAVRKLPRKAQGKGDSEKDDKSEDDSSSDSSDEDSSTSITSDDVPLTKMKGLLAHSRLSRGKALKRQAEESPDESPVEPVSKRSRVRGHVTSKTRSKRQPQVSDYTDSSSGSDSDDVPLSKVSKKDRKAPQRQHTRPQPAKKNSKQKKKHLSDEEFKSKAVVKSKGGKSKEIKPPADLDPDSNLSEEETGVRRSARVRSLRSRKKKEPSPDFVPSELEDFLDETETDDEFVVKSKRKKKKHVEDEVEIPKGRNAQRLEAKTKNKAKKPVEEEEEEDEAACCKCLKSNQPEWILLCDKCDAGYHTACLRPPLMMIPDGDWFCPPCEHGMLIAKLQENLQTLDTTLLKSDRLVRRKERLAFVGISLDNIIKEEERHEGDFQENSDSESGSSKSSNSENGSEKSSSESSDSSESSESSESRYPRRERARRERRLEKKARRRERKEEMRQSFIKRSCRSKNPISYKFEEYDELIMDAIQEDMSIPKEPKPKKVKPPGISRGKDMSNILGVSDEEEKKTKKPKKRRPRLTELDETDEAEDDTDDYHVSLESSATEVSAESEGVVESGSDFSDDMYNRRRRSRRRRGSRRTRKSGRKRRGCSRYDDFVVESDYESEDDTGRRSTRRKSARRPVNYRELNSDESEVKPEEDDSFHTSDVGSDDDRKKKSRSKKDKKRKHDESSEDWSEESDFDGKPSSKKKERKPPSRKKKYDSGDSESYSESSESEDRLTRKTLKKGKKNAELEKSESDDEENVKAKPASKKKKAVIESDSENEIKGQEDTNEKDEQENENNEANVGVEGKEMEDKVGKGENKEKSEKLPDAQDEGSETEVSEGEWEEVDITSGSDKGEKMKSPKRKASPARGGTSPKKGASSPKKESTAKKKGGAAKKGGASPKKTSPKKGGKKGSASPEKGLTSPVLSSEEAGETVPKEGENVVEESVTDDSAQVAAKPKVARKPKAPAKPKAAAKTTRKRKNTETATENIGKDSEVKLEAEPAISASVSEGTEKVEKETENISDTSLNPLDISVSDTSSLNLSHPDDLNKSEEQQDLGSGPELNDSKQETTPEGVPMKRKRTRRTKAQMEIFKKEEEVEIQKMVAQGIPEDVARRRRKSMHKRASLLRSRSQSLEQAPAVGGMPEPVDFLSDENVGIHIHGKLPTRSEGDHNVNVPSDIQRRLSTDHQMKPNETVSTINSNEETQVDKSVTESVKVEAGSDNAVKKDGEKVGDTKVYEEKRDDSPLSARRDYNNAPVGIVKPEVRQGVIVENRQVMDNVRSTSGPSGRAPGAGMVSPLQGMKDMTMGKMGEQGGFQPPNMPPGYQNRGNTEGFRQPQPNYPGFQPQQGPYGPSQQPQQPYQQGGPQRPYPYSDQQGPMSPTNYPPNSQYMSPNMPPGPQGYYPGPYRGPIGPGIEGPQSPQAGYSGYGPPGNQNLPPQGPYGQGFPTPPGPYQGQMQGPSPQGPMQGPHPGPSGPMSYPPNMQGGYPHAPQPHYPTPHGMQYPQNAPAISPNQPIRPQAIPASHPSSTPPDNQNVRPPMAGVPPRNRRGFMMDNILKPSSSSSGSQDGEPGDEINDIVNYVANDEYFKEH